MREIYGVIFDLDGVIADSHGLHETVWSALLAEAGREVSGAELAPILREGRTRAEILKKLFPHCSEAERARWSRRKESLFAEAMNDLQPVPGVVDWIRFLFTQGMPLAVATSASTRRALDTLARFSISPCVRSVVGSDNVAAGKPDPQLFVAAARALKLSASEVLVVEDSSAGLLAARAARMRSLWYCPELACALAPQDLSPEFVISAFTREELEPVNALLQTPVLASRVT